MTEGYRVLPMSTMLAKFKEGKPLHARRSLPISPSHTRLT
jgi:hypothetical protein